MFGLDLTEEEKNEIAKSIATLARYLPGEVVRIPQHPRKKAINNFFKMVKIVIRNDLLKALETKKIGGFAERVGKYFKHSEKLLIELANVYNKNTDDEELRLTSRDLSMIQRRYKEFLEAVVDGIKMAVSEAFVLLK